MRRQDDAFAGLGLLRRIRARGHRGRGMHASVNRCAPVMRRDGFACALLVGATLLVSACAPASADVAPNRSGVQFNQKGGQQQDTHRSTQPRPALEQAKADQLAAEHAVDARVPAASGMAGTRVRPLTLRDSGIDGALMFARHVDFRLTGDIGFMIDRMAATLTPTHAGAPIVFDDPTSVTIHVHRGDVLLDSAKLTAIFNRYLFQYRGSPLRNMRVVPRDDGSLRITGEMNRDGWVPVALTGTLAMRNARELVFHADHVQVAGVDADHLMQAAHVRMADLLKVATPIVRLEGDDVVMQVAKLTPPPALHMTITQIETSAAGVRFTLDDHTLRGIDWPARMPARGLLLEGGDVKFMRSMPMNIDMAIEPLPSASATAPFVLDLYHYRDQMARGYFTFDEQGALDVRLPSCDTLADASGDDDRAQTGSAAARFNDSFLRAQQAALAQAREQWQAVQVSGPAAGHAGASAQNDRLPMRVKTGFAPAAPAPVPALGARRSAGPEPLVHMQNVDFFVAGRIGFHIRSLDAQLVPKVPGQPVDLDDPNQYDIHILGGEVIEPWPAMAALFNDYLLDYTPRSLNALTLAPEHGMLRVSGGIRLWNHFPGVWLPTTMRGTLVARDDRHLVYTPTSVSVLGVPQAGLLHALDIPLASLTPFARKGVKLVGNQLVFDQDTVFPPPVLAGRLARARVTDAGLVLDFQPQRDAPRAQPPADAGSSYVWIESGDVRMFDSLVTNARTLIRNSAAQGPMRFDLYDYRRDVARGTVRMNRNGTLRVDLAPRQAG
jgi:hypothetical protein